MTDILYIYTYEAIAMARDSGGIGTTLVNSTRTKRVVTIIKKKPPSFATTMPAEPTNLQATTEARASRKRQAPLNDNGEPVTVPVPKRRKNITAQSTSAAPPKKVVPTKRKPSVEEIPEAPVHSDPPRNPRNILEASDGSDDEFDGPPSSATSPMQVDSDEDEVNIVEEPEEDDEAELGLCLLSFLRA
jgi:hypothetical protein